MKQRKSEINWKLVVRVACLMLLDVVLLYLACLLALLSRFDLSIHTLMRDSGFLPALHAAFPWVAIGMIALFIPLKLYSSLWEFAGVEELLHILCACFLFAAATLLLILFGVLDLPRSFPVLAGLYLVALLSASRFSYRLIRTILHRSGSEKRKKRTMLIGAGSAGMLVLREFQTSENSQNNVVCVIDDDRDKLGKYIRNVKIAGTRDDIVALAQSRRIEEIVLAIPTAAVRERRNILQLCQKTGCRLKILPGILSAGKRRGQHPEDPQCGRAGPARPRLRGGRPLPDRRLPVRQDDPRHGRRRFHRQRGLPPARGSFADARRAAGYL